MENKMEKYIIGYGLGGSFGGIQNYLVVIADSFEDAELQAYDQACEEYEEYDGMYGLRSIEAIMEEDGVDSGYAEYIWREEREDWLVYDAQLYTEELEKELGDMIYNPFKK